MVLFEFSTAERHPNQTIVKATVDDDEVIFLDTPGPGGGVDYIMAPNLCIKRLVEALDQGQTEGVFDCEESEDPLNYLGAKIEGDTVYLNRQFPGRPVEVKIISAASLLKLHSALLT